MPQVDDGSGTHRYTGIVCVLVLLPLLALAITTSISSAAIGHRATNRLTSLADLMMMMMIINRMQTRQNGHC